MKIWVDTDIGSEIDDALALAYLLSNPAVEVLGISTVTEQARTRAMLASALCHAAERPDIPIHPGCEKTMQGAPFGQPVSQAAALRFLGHRTDFENCDAVAGLRRAVYDNSGEVTLLAIGPLSNVAQLFLADQQAPARLRKLVTMGGNFSDSVAARETVEWNVALDPESADFVFRTPVAGGHYLVGLEATHSLKLASGALKAQRLPPVLRAVLKLHEAKYAVEKPLTMYDAAAAMLAVNPSLGATERGIGSIDVNEERGKTEWQCSDSGNHLCFRDVSSEKTLEEFLATFNLCQETC